MTDPDTRFEKIRLGEHASKDGGSVVQGLLGASHTTGQLPLRANDDAAIDLEARLPMK
jgi:hypothetical protein